MPSGVGTATSRSLHSIHADTRVFHRAGIEKATLENGRLHLKCVGNAQGYYSDTIHTEFEWKLFTSPAIRTNAPMVIVRCINPCKGTFQRFIEYLQQQDWSWTGTRLDFPTFKGRFHREQNQCVDYDLILSQVINRPEIVNRLKKGTAPSSKKNKLRVLYVFMDSTSRRNFVNNFPETKSVFQDATVKGVAKTFAFPFAHSLGSGTTERAFYAFAGGSRVANFGASSWKFWKRLDLIWKRAKQHGWYTAYANEGCFLQEHRDVFKSKGGPNLTLSEQYAELGDHVVSDAFCGGCGEGEEYCDMESAAQWTKQYRNGEYHIKNFLADERSCEGGRRPSSNFLEWTGKVMQKYKEHSGFLMFEWAAAHLFREHEHVCAAQHYFDGSFAAFVDELLNNGMLDETVIIMAGDHGNWHMEEKGNPFMSITVPQKFLKQHPDIARNLHNNQRSIVTHLDLHETVVELINLVSPLTPGNTNKDEVDSLRKFPIKEFLAGGGQSKDPHAWRSGMSGFPGRSLLGVIPGKRTCEDAGVDKGEQYCYVSHRLKSPFKPIKPSKWFVAQLGAHLESSMNNKTLNGYVHFIGCKSHGLPFYPHNCMEDTLYACYKDALRTRIIRGQASTPRAIGDHQKKAPSAPMSIKTRTAYRNGKNRS